jgi:acetylornithine deacetylase/succinyl-diaminopimelate desuccinylase-like protein
MMDGSRIDQAVQRGREAALEELRAFCAQPSVSAQDTGMKEMAALVMEALRRRGFTTRPAQTRRHPAILAECRGRSSRSVLFYNHYDVQPPEPLDQWASPPFTPSLRDGKLFARGVMDDKGHLACRLAAIDAVRDAQGGLPCTVKFLVEGEEEIASPNLEQIVLQNRDALAADVCVWEFGEVDEEGVSNQFLGFRGLLYVELSLQELSQDCHSGIWGTLLPNAAWRLNWALSTLKERDERIRIPGFYDAVVPPSHQDMKLMEKLPLIPLSQAMGARRFLAGHPSPAEFHRRAVMSPSCTICGLTAGYQGPGQKTIVPARASAKVDFRLVPNQTPDEILSKLKAHLEAEGFGDIEVTCFGRLNPSRTPVDHPLVRMAVESAREVYGQPQRVFPMSGGSGPAHLFTGHLGMPVLTTGVGYLGSNIHSPNENIRLTDFYNGIRHTARMLAAMGEG